MDTRAGAGLHSQSNHRPVPQRRCHTCYTLLYALMEKQPQPEMNLQTSLFSPNRLFYALSL